MASHSHWLAMSLECQKSVQQRKLSIAIPKRKGDLNDHEQPGRTQLCDAQHMDITWEYMLDNVFDMLYRGLRRPNGYRYFSHVKKFRLMDIAKWKSWTALCTFHGRTMVGKVRHEWRVQVDRKDSGGHEKVR